MKPRSIPFLFAYLSMLASVRAEPAPKPIEIVTSPQFDIEYSVNEAALPLDSVRLWYTTDGGQSWVDYGADVDRIPPIRFRAQGEGRYGFFFVLSNSAGASSDPPAVGTAAQQTVLVDFTPPLVQLHQARAQRQGSEVIVQIRWSAVDAHFSPRPIEVLYGLAPDQDLARATPEPVANTGMFDWNPPSNLIGSIVVKVRAVDLAGQSAESEPVWVEIPPPTAPSPLPPRSEPALSIELPGLDDAALAGSQRARERAEQLVGLSRQDELAGRLPGAVARLREAVKLDPGRADAFARMGSLLYSLGDLDRAFGAYEIALKLVPTDREPLRGMATILQRKGEYSAAAEKLQTFLRYHPKDAAVWLQLGDVAVHQGDEIKARDCYLRASQIDPHAGAVIADAQKRLALMAEVSRTPPGGQ